MHTTPLSLAWVLGANVVTALAGPALGECGSQNSPCGINAHAPQGASLAVLLDEVQVCGIGWIRVDLVWAWAEPGQDQHYSAGSHLFGSGRAPYRPFLPQNRSRRAGKPGRHGFALQCQFSRAIYDAIAAAESVSCRTPSPTGDVSYPAGVTPVKPTSRDMPPRHSQAGTITRERSEPSPSGVLLRIVSHYSSLP